jgi:hypothetical protein
MVEKTTDNQGHTVWHVLVPMYRTNPTTRLNTYGDRYVGKLTCMNPWPGKNICTGYPIYFQGNSEFGRSEEGNRAAFIVRGLGIYTRKEL